MRPLSLLLPASLLVLAASASAQQSANSPPGAAPLNTVQVTAPAKGRWVRPDEAKQIGGDYDMSNGWLVRVKTAPEYIEASIDRQQPIRLTAVARHRFVSADGAVNMVFAQGIAGDEMTMNYRPDPALAQVLVLTSRVAQR